MWKRILEKIKSWLVPSNDTYLKPILMAVLKGSVKVQRDDRIIGNINSVYYLFQDEKGNRTCKFVTHGTHLDLSVRHGKGHVIYTNIIQPWLFGEDRYLTSYLSGKDLVHYKNKLTSVKDIEVKETTSEQSDCKIFSITSNN